MPKDFYSYRVIDGANPAADAAGRSSDTINMKGVNRAQIIVKLTQGNAATVTLSLMQTKDAANTGAKAFGNNIPIFANLDTSVSDQFVRQADGVSFTTDAALKNKIVIFDIDPAQMDVQGGFTHVYITTGASNVANITDVTFIMDQMVKSVLPPTLIT